jgi:nucleotide-binding universal stress UspA family protein
VTDVFDHIVVAVDGSKEGGKTVPAAVEVASRFGSALTILHVREHTKYEGEDVDLGPAQDAETITGSALEICRAAGVAANAEIRRVSPGDTPDEIVRVASELGADLLVLGTRGMSEWKSLLLGGVANKVVAHAHCPVLLVR